MGRVECGNNKESRLWITTVLRRPDCQSLLLNHPINGGLANVQVGRHGQPIAPHFIQALLHDGRGLVAQRELVVGASQGAAQAQG